MHNKVIWSEGMLLQPHHLQQQTRYFDHLLEQTQQHAFPWGILSITINQDRLRMGQFELLSLQGYFPNGTYIDAPHIDALPNPLTIEPHTHDVIIYACIPLDNLSQANTTLAPTSNSHRHISESINIANDITECPQPAEIKISRLNIQLTTEKAHLDTMHYIPIAQIESVTSHKQIQLSNAFIPPLCFVQGSPFLCQAIDHLHELLENRADNISARLTNSQQSTHAEVTDLLLLQVTNRYEAIFSHINQDSTLTLAQLYLYLKQLIAEMATYTKDQRRFTQPPPFNHASSYDCFATLFNEAEKLLSAAVEQHAKNIPLIAGAHGAWIGHIDTPEQLSQGQMILAIKAQCPSEVIQQTIPTQIKISDTATIEGLIRRSLPGIEITLLTTVPRQIPFETQLHYFLLDSNHSSWAEIISSGQIAIHISGNFPGLQLMLWAIKG